MKKVVCVFCGPRADFDIASIKVLQWAMMRKGISEVLFGSVMSLYEVAKTRVSVDSEFSEEFKFEKGIHQSSVLSLFFAVAVDDANGLEINGVLSELLYADDLVLVR